MAVTDLYNVDYRLDAPERMWYTQKGMKNAVDDLDRNEPDRAGLMGYDTDQDEKAGIAGVDDDSHRQTLKVETDRFVPDGGTDIAGGLDEAKEILERDYGNGPDGSTDATKNIVLMTDGKDNDGEDPVDYIQDNRDEFENTFIHVIILGETAADSEEAIEDMGALADDPNPDLSGSDVDPDDLPDWEAVNDPNRVNGTLIASDDPADAENIFDNIIGSIEDETEFEEPNSSITDPGNDVSGTVVANSGVVEEIYDFRMNVTDFTSNGTYRINIVDTDDSGNQELIWRMDVDNKMADNDASTPGYEVEFGSETDNSLNATLQRTFEGNLSDDVSPDEYVWFDLTGKDSDRPRFKMGPSGPDEDDYNMEAAWQEISDQMDDGGVAIETTELNPYGQVNGTFSLDFKPLNGNFSRVNNIAGGGFAGECDPSASGEIIKCGWDDPGNERNAVSTAQIRDARVLVTVEGPGGISEREIRIDDFIDIYRVE
ncbi:MAG: vWA domain-containing protein [Halobacteriales archaeon]|nr:vWA domain-containing protein [Halobacteriales archaeon]